MRDTARQARYDHWRRFKDRLARAVVIGGGLAVIGALLLIFAYLFYVVLPLFKSPAVEPVAAFGAPGGGETLYLATQEHAEVGLRLTRAGEAVFFDTRSGTVLQRQGLPLPADVAVTSFAAADPNDRVVAYGLANGQALVVRHSYRLSFENDRRRIHPELEFPLGERPVTVSAAGQPLSRLAVQLSDDGASLVAAAPDGRLSMTYYSREESFLDERVSWRGQAVELPRLRGEVTGLLIDRGQTKLYAIENGRELNYFDVSDKHAPELAQRLSLVHGKERVTAAELLAGGTSLLVGTSRGEISQWFLVRNAKNQRLLTEIRHFDAQREPILHIAPEFGRKGFTAVDASGRVVIYHATAHRVVDEFELGAGGVRALAMAPRADAILAETADGRIRMVSVSNDHPEISWRSLWGKVWYEGYDEPDYVWQSTAGSNEFEPKLSLAPLSFGTLKAAFYAMLFAVPLGIMAAIYTAYFMAPSMRRVVKPTVELMEALPTVILGFLAGLWLAPVVETHLPGFVALLLLLPPGVLLFGWLWSRLPLGLRARLPEGWHAALLVPVILLIGYAAFGIGAPLEALLFGGDFRNWLTHEAGIDFDQRNSLVVGMAMGFAVIPTIFSIAEDAIFSVPKHLSFGALALGSTPWQALSRVVLLTASPGIFSAVMIGLGRAVGETMIVLMATGNTPVMDWNLFEGMRTLSANIAVEMPESEVGSTHFRVLFLAGLVLFLFTFAVNTAAELVRQRLRRKYSAL